MYLAGCVGSLLCSIGILILFPGTAVGQGSYTVGLPHSGQEDANIKKKDDRPIATQRISIVLKDSTLSYALRSITKMAGLGVAFDTDDSLFKRKVSIDLRDMDVLDAVNKTIEGTRLIASLSPNGEVVVLRRSSNQAKRAKNNSTETGSIIGRVIDSATNDGLSGVSVSVTGILRPLITDSKGEFIISEIPIGSRTITFKLLGYRTVTRPVQVTSNAQVKIDVKLVQAASILTGVVTTATGEQRKLEVGNSIATLNVDSIMKVAPVASMTDLLESRVPGMTIQRTSGTPGDPARIRLRGTGSIYANNDPIIVVDGVRMYSQQSDERNQNALTDSEGGGLGERRYSTPSPLDQIDPNSIERIEVLKGPSASAMYGSDAANGVIVITTKRGRGGPAQVNIALRQGYSYMPGSWPTSLWNWYTPIVGGPPEVCRGDCNGLAVDSVVAFSALNDPYFTALGRGSSSDGSATVSGGSQTLRYAFTVSGGMERGVLKLPKVDEDRYFKYQGTNVPGWMRRPDNLENRSGTGSVDIQFSDKSAMSVTSTLGQQTQRRTSMSASGQSAIRELEQKWADRSQLPERPLLGNPYERVTAQTLNITNSIRVNAEPIRWMPINATIGMNSLIGDNEMIIPKGLLTGAAERGVWNGSTKTSSVTTATVSTLIPIRSRLDLAAGVNLVKSSTNDQKGGFRGFQDGVVDPASGEDPQSTSYSRSSSENNNFGWFLEPRINLRSRLFVMPGFRLDNNGLAGKNAGLNSLPKMNLSWVASDEEFFPLSSVLSLLRLRLAFGVAGVQPRPGDTYRLFKKQIVEPFNGTDPNYGTMLSLSYLGNTQLKPERGVEWEGGFDAELWEGRINIDVTHYRKRRNNAIVDNPYAMSVNGGGKTKVNVGDLENTGSEVTLGVNLIESSIIGVNVKSSFSWNRSKVIRLSEDGEKITAANVISIRGSDGTSSNLRQEVIYAVGYPMQGIWQRPIIGFADVDGSGWITSDEVILGADPVFVGTSEPKVTIAMHPGISLLRGMIGINMSFSYSNGMSQDVGTSQNTLNGLWGSTRQGHDYARQAALSVIRNTRYGFIQNVNQLRFQSLSISANVRRKYAEILRAKSASISLQGSNLGLWTNYMGVDPNVNALSGSHGVMDAGQLPQPRAWILRLSLVY